MAIDVRDHVPAVGLETLRRVVGEPAARLAVDRDAVVVVESGELAQAQCSGERARLVRDAFHQAAVAGEHVSAMVDDRVSGPIEVRRQKRFGERHADGVGETLPERSGRRLDAGRHADFRMSGRFRMQLAKPLELRNRQVVAGQMKQRVLKHRAMSVRQHEAIAVGPVRIRRIMVQMPRRERANGVGELMVGRVFVSCAAARGGRGIRHDSFRLERRCFAPAVEYQCEGIENYRESTSFVQ